MKKSTFVGKIIEARKAEISLLEETIDALINHQIDFAWINKQPYQGLHKEPLERLTNLREELRSLERIMYSLAIEENHGGTR